MKTILKRVERLEKAVIPPEPWRITVELWEVEHVEDVELIGEHNQQEGQRGLSP